ncbi:MAG: dUTP diphosphatase [Candidatus Hodarchaeales archaeon]|jgi:dUTP pyrophosphatase
MVILKVKKINPKDPVDIPKFAYDTDACADIQSNVNTTLNPSEFKLISTGLKFQIEQGWEVQIRPRSGLAAKFGVTVLNTPGTIDAGYRGEIKIIMINHGKEPFHIKVGERIAQIAIREVSKVKFIEVDKINETDRNEGGFGSTGINNS